MADITNLFRSRTRSGSAGPAFRPGTAFELAGGLALSGNARSLLREDMDPGQFVDALVGARHSQEAALFLAHALPPESAIRWALPCARRALERVPGAELLERSIQVAEAWLESPGEARRQTAGQLAERANHSGLAGLLAMAVFHGGDRETPGAPRLAAGCAYGVIALSVAEERARKPDRRFRELVRHALRGG